RLKWIQELAYFNGSECPAEYRYHAEELYQKDPANFERVSIFAAATCLGKGSVRSWGNRRFILICNVFSKTSLRDAKCLKPF
ncbi:MAG: hypothetical protein FGF53_10610, partial [Candidatus Brockarchaeota archaeon]|nr:hypothetical protein [Candidatus Brockarchaeota archaeon]